MWDAATGPSAGKESASHLHVQRLQRMFDICRQQRRPSRMSHEFRRLLNDQIEPVFDIPGDRLTGLLGETVEVDGFGDVLRGEGREGTHDRSHTTVWAGEEQVFEMAVNGRFQRASVKQRENGQRSQRPWPQGIGGWS